jgi:TP901 family phage tail tape measure protein
MAMTAADIKVQVGADVDQAVQGLNQVDQTINKGKKNAGGMGLVMGAVSTGIFAGFGLAVNGAMNYEAAMNAVQASLGATNPQMEQLGALALDIGAKTQFSATQGAQAIEELGKAGVAIPDILGGAALSAAQLASATGTDIPMAANVMANAMNVFGIAGEDATRVADVMTAALNASSLNMNDFANGMASVGTSAASLGVPLEDTAAALAIFSNRGMSGADAGTALRSMFTHLASPTAESAALMNELGIAAFDAQGNFVGLEGLAGQLQTQMAGLTDEQRLNALSTIFGADAQRVANILFEEGASGVAAMTDELQANGQAQAAAEIRMQGLSGALESLKGSAETMFITFGKLLLPVLTKLAIGATKLINAITNLSKPIKVIIASVAGAVAVFGLFAGGFSALLAAMGPVGAMLAPLAAGIGALILPFILITGAVVGLYLAFRNNFLGIQDIVMSIVDPIVAFANTFISAMSQAFDAGTKVNDLIYLFPAPLREMMSGFLLAADAVGDLWRAFQQGGLEGLIDALPGKLGQLRDALMQMVTGGLHALATAFESVDWGALGALLLSGLTTAASYAADFAGIIIEHAGALGAKLGVWVWRQLESVPWGPILSAGLSALRNIAGFIIEKAGDLGASLKTWYDNAIDSVNWGGIGQQAGEAVRAAVLLIAPMALDLVTGFATFLRENWFTIIKVLGGLILGIPAAIGYIGMTMLPKVIEFLEGFAEGLGINWGIVGGWFLGLPGRILQAIPGLAGTLLQEGIDLLVGLFNGLIEYWPNIKRWLGTLGSLAIAAIGSLLEYAIPRGIQLLSGLYRGILAYWPTIVDWLKGLGSLAAATVGSLLEYLLARGRQLMKGLETAAVNYWEDEIVPWLKGLPGMALAAVPDMYYLLMDKGRRLIKGMWDGAMEIWNQFTNWASSLNPFNWLPDLPGPLSWGSFNVSSAMSVSAAPMTAAATFGAPTGGSTVVYHDNRTFTVDVDSLEDVASVVGVIQDLQRDRELVYGSI